MKKLFSSACFLIILIGMVNAQNIIFIDFKYDNLTVETVQKTDGKLEKKIIDYGQSDFNLQLRDLIVFYLIDKKYNATTKQDKNANIIVKIHPVILLTGVVYDYSIEVEIYDNNNNLLNRKLFRAWAKYGNDITTIASEDIGNYIINFIKK